MKILKKCSYALITTMIYCTSILATNDDKVKIYIPENLIGFTDQQILIDIDGEEMALDALYIDENGFYVYQIALMECPGCGRKTFDRLKLTCPRCDFPDPNGRWIKNQ
jgi:hypothetical protein